MNANSTFKPVLLVLLGLQLHELPLHQVCQHLAQNLNHLKHIICLKPASMRCFFHCKTSWLPVLASSLEATARMYAPAIVLFWPPHLRFTDT